MPVAQAYVAFGTVLRESMQDTFNFPENENFADHIARKAGLIPPDVMDVRAMIAYADARYKAVEAYPFDVLLNGDVTEEAVSYVLVLKSSVLKSSGQVPADIDVDELRVAPADQAMFCELCAELGISDPQWMLFANYGYGG